MLEIIKQIDLLQERINNNRPLDYDELEELKQYFKIGLTFSSNALEGNSLTETETKVVLEDGITIGGKPLRDHLEAVGHAQAFDHMYKLIKDQEITENNIKYLHKLFYQAIDNKNAGVYRKRRVFISGSQYNDSIPAPSEVPNRMKQFIEDISTRRAKLHPVEFAALLHKEFVFIHPFVDGNGRVARLIMNLALLQHGYPIIVIPPILRSEYIRLLEKAHIDETNFIQFIAERIIENQRDYIRLLQF